MSEPPVGGPPDVRRRVAVAVLVVALVAGPAGAVVGSGATTAQSAATADVVFVFDRSANVEALRDEFADELPGIEERLDAENVDARYGLVSYESDARVETALTSDPEAVAEDLGDVELSGSFENASTGVLAASGMDFRPGAERVYVVVSNEDDSDDAAAVADANAVLREGDRTLFAMGPDAWESRTEDVGGHWYDVPSAFENGSADVAGGLDRLAEVTASEAPTDSSDGPEFETVDLSMNRTSAEVGDPVRFNVTVANEGSRTGTFHPILTADMERIAQSEREVSPGESRTFTYVHRFAAPGSYQVMMRNDRIGRLTVTERGPTEVDVSQVDRNVLLARIDDARAGDPVDVALPRTVAARRAAVTFERLAVNTTTTADLSLTATHRVEGVRAPNGSTGVRPLSAMSVESSANGSAVDNASVWFSVARNESNAAGSTVAVYHVDDASGTTGWLAPTLVEETERADRYRVDAAGLSTFVVAVREPVFGVDATELGATTATTGTAVDVTATVGNRGAANGSYAADLRVDGETVASKSVSVPAGGTRTVTFSHAFDAAGQHRVAVGDARAGTVTVEQAATPTTSATASTATPGNADDGSATATPAAGSDSEGGDGNEDGDAATATGGTGPGLGVLAALVALGSLSLLARLRRA